MNSPADFFALAAFLSPVFVLAAMNLMLRLIGEEDSLLLPRIRPFPSLSTQSSGRDTARVPSIGDRHAIHEALFRKAA